MQLYVLARHGHSTLNVAGRVNGDPAVAVDLTEEGRAEAEALGLQLAHLPLSLCVCTRFAEIPIRYALNGAAGSAELDAPVHAIPNAAPYLVDAAALARAAARIEELAG